MEEYVTRFRPELMEAAAAWYRGDRFLDVQRMTDFFEVRMCFREH